MIIQVNTGNMGFTLIDNFVVQVIIITLNVILITVASVIGYFIKRLIDRVDTDIDALANALERAISAMDERYYRKDVMDAKLDRVDVQLNHIESKVDRILKRLERGD